MSVLKPCFINKVNRWRDQCHKEDQRTAKISKNCLHHGSPPALDSYTGVLRPPFPYLEVYCWGVLACHLPVRINLEIKHEIKFDTRTGIFIQALSALSDRHHASVIEYYPCPPHPYWLKQGSKDILRSSRLLGGRQPYTPFKLLSARQ